MNGARNVTRIAGLSIVLNIILFGLKFWIGSTIGSIAIVADAWHSMSDSMTSAIVIIGARLSGTPPDRDHPFGHGRFELVATLAIGIMLAMVALSFLHDAFSSLREQKIVSFNMAAIIITAISALAKEGLTQISFFVGKKWKSKSLIADGWHHRSDALSSLVIFIGILFSSRFWWIDGALGIAVAVLILIAAWQIVRDSVSPLVGTIPSGPMVEEIAKTCREIGGIDVEAHHFHLHEYGDHREMTFHIKVPGERTVDAAHALADRIELVLRDRMNIEATIHVEPGKATAIPDPSTLS